MQKRYIVLLTLSLFALAIFFSVLYKDKFISSSKTSQLAQLSASLSNGLVAYYTFDEGSGTTAGDGSGNGNTGTLVNGPTWATGKVSGALNFDGTNDKVTTSGDFVGTSPLTISAWIYARSYGSGVSARILDNSKAIFRIGAYNNRLMFSSDGATYPHAGNDSMALNEWRHVVVTRDSSGIVNFYVNGTQRGTANQNSGTPAGGPTVYIGTSSNSSHPWDGLLDDLRVYSRVLSASEITELYNYTGTASTPAPASATPSATSDTTNPTVSFNEPAANATVSGIVAVSANASDDTAVAGVQFKIDGSNFGSEIVYAPYTISFNSIDISNGSHTISAVARDVAQNTNTASVSVTVSNQAADTTAPLITSIGASSITTTGAVISWTTDEPADTQVEYGPAISYYGNETA